jgi:formylglycine-generating enzyme required for sulfatase activity
MSVQLTRLYFLLSLLIASSASAVTMDWVTVADPGNPGDPQESCYLCEPGMAFGSVSAAYRISKYEVTYTQYAEFLNAVAATTPMGSTTLRWSRILVGSDSTESPGATRIQ